jgi:hypothetical protein
VLEAARSELRTAPTLRQYDHGSMSAGRAISQELPDEGGSLADRLIGVMFGNLENALALLWLYERGPQQLIQHAAPPRLNLRNRVLEKL